MVLLGRRGLPPTLKLTASIGLLTTGMSDESEPNCPDICSARDLRSLNIRKRTRSDLQLHDPR